MSRTLAKNQGLRFKIGSPIVEIELGAAVLAPTNRVVDAVVSPKHFAVDDEGRRAEHAERLGLFGRLLADRLALGRFNDPGGALTDLSQGVGKTGLRTRFVAGVEPMPIGGAT